MKRIGIAVLVLLTLLLFGVQAAWAKSASTDCTWKTTYDPVFVECVAGWLNEPTATTEAASPPAALAQNGVPDCPFGNAYDPLANGIVEGCPNGVGKGRPTATTEATLQPAALTQATKDRTPGIEPEAGEWPTWVLTSGSQFRPPAPPRGANTAAEIAELKALAEQRDAADLQQIAYWDGGAPSYRWIEIAIAQARAAPAPAPRVARMLSLLNVALYDSTVAAWDAKYTYNRARPATRAPNLSVLAQHTNSPSYPSEHAVAAGAASTILAYIYPDNAQALMNMAQAAADSRLLAGAHYRSDVTAGLELGRQVAQQVIARAEKDKDIPPWDGVIPTGKGYWTGEKPVEPTAGQWQTWALTSGSEFRPGPPLSHDSAELAAELQEVVKFERTWQTTQKALWWQSLDGGFESWYTFVSLRLFEQGLDANPPAAARAYTLMSVAFHDSLVACWDAKFTYWFFRPYQMEPTLTTLFPPPNYPSYPSGHACASNAISEVLAHLFPASAETVRARAAEAFESRIWAGIHFRHEMVAGKALGEAVARKVLEHDQQDRAVVTKQ